MTRPYPPPPKICERNYAPCACARLSYGLTPLF
jgi:hypothetical protein